MKVINIFKNIILYFFYAILSTVFFPFTIYKLFTGLKEAGYGFMAYGDMITEPVENMFLWVLNYEGVIYVIGIALYLITGLILLAAYFLPYIILAILWIQLYDPFVIRRKNAYCGIFYNIEALFHLKHKERLTGDQWAKNREEAEKAEKRRQYQREKKVWEAEQERKKQERYEQWRWEREYQEQQYQDTNNSYNDYDNSSNSNSNGSTGYSDSYNEKLIHSMGVLMIEDINKTTEEELKKQRNLMIKKFHPDGNKDDENFTKMSEQINNAYDFLLNHIRNK